MVPETWAGSRKRGPRGAGGRMTASDAFALAPPGGTRKGEISCGSAAKQAGAQIRIPRGVRKGGRSSVGFPSVYRIGLVRDEMRSKER